MASFEQHLNSAVVATGVAIAPLYSSNLIDMDQALGLLVFGIFGGVLPDIDSENSKPLQVCFKILSIFLPLVAILTLLDSLSISKMLAIWGVSSLLLHFIIFRLFINITSHRGIFHSIPMGLLYSLGIYFIFSKLLEFDMLYSMLCGIFLFLGYIVHLLLDELVSLNALGISIKKSFGTALKLYDKNNLIGTIVVYSLIIVFLFITPIQIDDVTKIVDSFHNIKF